MVLKVQGAANVADYEAMPASGFGQYHTSRDLVPRVADGDALRFQWPPDNEARTVLPAGRSTVKITVLEVGPTLAGEKVKVGIVPPLSFKHFMPGYGFLSWFYFWPVYGFFLALYAVFLGWQTYRNPIRKVRR